MGDGDVRTGESWDAIARRAGGGDYQLMVHDDLARAILDLKARVEELERWRADVMSPPALGTHGVVVDGPEDVRSIQERWAELERRHADKVSDGAGSGGR